MSGKLFAVSDLHAGYRANQVVIDQLRPESDQDWLVVAGDTGETVTDIKRTLRCLADRFETVIWAPGNHELWTTRTDPLQLRGEPRYLYLVDLCRDMGVITPEDPFPVYYGAGFPVVIAPLFILYDYSFRTPGLASKEVAVADAYNAGVVCSDEFVLHPDPYPSREAWCHARIAATEERLGAVAPDLPTVLVNHFPLIRDSTRRLRYPEFALWCGTQHTAQWHIRYRALAVVYGHLHMPGTTLYDGVPFEEVSLGYPHEWQDRMTSPRVPRQILPRP